MDPVRKAIWYVESHLQEPISLDAIARACKVSTFHLTRAFASTTGHSLMRYVRARRLSEAARRLASGAQDILTLALDSGYGSHEAFTRAFREHFQQTPEQVRGQKHVENLDLQEAITMSMPVAAELEPPRFERHRSFFLQGLSGRYSCESAAGIPGQWQKLAPHLGSILHQVGDRAYGVSMNFDEEGAFDYVCGVEVSPPSRVADPWLVLEIPENSYAVFQHRGHVAGIRATCSAIWSDWLPTSGREPIQAPMFERYGKEFNPSTGLGGFEIWIPIRD